MLFPFFTDGERGRCGEAEKQVHTVAGRKDPGTDESQAAWPARGIPDGLRGLEEELVSQRSVPFNLQLKAILIPYHPPNSLSVKEREK